MLRQREASKMKRERVLLTALVIIVVGLVGACGSPQDTSRMSDDAIDGLIETVLEHVRAAHPDGTSSPDCQRIIESQSVDWTVSNDADGLYTARLDGASFASEPEFAWNLVDSPEGAATFVVGLPCSRG